MTLDVWLGMTRALTLTCLTLAALHGHAHAQSPPAGGAGGQAGGPEIRLTLDQAIARARAHAERVAASRVALDDGEARVGLAGRRLTSNPSVEAVFGGAANPASPTSLASAGLPASNAGSGLSGASGASGASGGTTAASEITVTQMFDIGARRTSRIGEARAGIAADRARASDITRTWVRDAALLFVRAQHAQTRERLLASAEDTAAAFLNVAERRYAAGDVAVLDVNVARAALAKARADRRALAADRIDVMGQLRARLGMTVADGPIVVEGTLDAAMFPGAVATASSVAPPPASASASAPASASTSTAAGPVAVGANASVPALADHPALATLRAELAEAEAARAAARASTAPEFGATSKYMRDDGSNVWLGGVTLTLPIANRGRERQAIASARVTRARVALDLEQRALEQDARSAMETHRLRVEAAQLLERDALPGLDENDTLARRSYEAGELSLTDSLAIRQQALDMRLAHADRLLDAATSGILAQAAAGVLR